MTYLRTALPTSVSFSVFSEARQILFLIWNSPSLSRNTTGVPTNYMCTLLQLSIFVLLHVGLHSHTFNLEYSCPFSLSFLNSSSHHHIQTFWTWIMTVIQKEMCLGFKEPENLFFLFLALVYQAIKGIKPRSIQNYVQLNTLVFHAYGLKHMLKIIDIVSLSSPTLLHIDFILLNFQEHI